jgi:hypothetical protein
MKDPARRETLVKIAADYDRLAEGLEHLAKGENRAVVPAVKL